MASPRTETTSNEITYVDDFLWQEILSRLPVKSAFLSKCVSKYWLSLISEPYFVHKHLQFQSNSNGDGEDDRNAATLLFMEITNDGVLPKCLGYPSPPFHSKGFSLDFIPVSLLQEERVFEFIEVSHDWVLCRSETTPGDDTSNPKCYEVNYHVCNPLTQQWLDIPLSPRIQYFAARMYSTAGLICEEEDVSCTKPWFSSQTPQFKVTDYLLSFDRLSNINIHGRTFSSETWQWSDLCIIHCHHHPAVLLTWSSLIDRYMILHYATTHYLLAIDPNSDDFEKAQQKIHLPVGVSSFTSPRMRFHLGLCHGHIHLSQLEYHGGGRAVSLSVWKLIKGSDTSEPHCWSLLKTMKITVSQIVSDLVVTVNCCSRGTVEVIGFSPLDKHIVYLRWGNHIALVNLKSKTVKKIGDLTDNRRTFMSFVPFVFPYWKLLMQNYLTNSSSVASTSNNS